MRHRRTSVLVCLALTTTIGCGDDGSQSTTNAGDSGADTMSSTAATDDGLDSSGAGAACGDAVVDPGEDCDDGNDIDGDGCNIDCRTSGTVQWMLDVATPTTLPDLPQLSLANDSAALYRHVATQAGPIDHDFHAELSVYDRDGDVQWFEQAPPVPGDGADFPLNAIGLDDGGMLLSYFANGAGDGRLRKYAADGSVEWEQDTDPAFGTPYRLIPQPGRFVVLGDSFEQGEWFAAYNYDGDLQWDRSAGVEGINTVGVAPDGSTILRDLDSVADTTDIFIFDPLGVQTGAWQEAGAQVGALAATSSGYWYWRGGGIPGVLTRLSSTGEEDFTVELPLRAHSIAGMPDGGVVVTGGSDTDDYVTRLDATGQTMWSTAVPGTSVWSVTADSSGFIWVTGAYATKGPGEPSAVWLAGMTP